MENAELSTNLHMCRGKHGRRQSAQACARGALIHRVSKGNELCFSKHMTAITAQRTQHRTGHMSWCIQRSEE